jgi:hypothetical protein
MKTLSMASVVGAVLSKSMAFGVMLLAPTGVSGQGSVDYFAGFGSFEGGANSPPLVFGGSSTSSSIDGWRLSYMVTLPAWLENGQAQDGDRHILLRSRGGSGPGSSSATFDFAISPTPFTAGELYELVFWAAGGVATSSRSSLTVAFNRGGGVGGGGIIDLPRYTQAEFDSFIELPWEEYRFTFTAGEFAPELRLSSQAANASGTASVYVDNFSIRPVPEPSGVLLVGVAVGVGLMRRRR